MRRKKYINILRNMNLFKDFSEEDLKDLFEEIDYSVKEYEKEDIIFMEDEDCKNLSIILEGNIEIQKIDPSGKVLVVAKFNSGETFGENLIFGDRNTFPMAVISKDKSTVLHISKDSITKLCQRDSSFLYEFLQIVSNRALVLGNKLKEISLKTIKQKICEYLMLEYARQKTLEIIIPMTRKDWADKIGAQRPSLSRELIKLKEEGVIDFDRDTISIKNLKLLKQNMS